MLPSHLAVAIAREDARKSLICTPRRAGRLRRKAGPQYRRSGGRHFLVERDNDPPLDLLVEFLAEHPQCLGWSNDRQRVKIVAQRALLQLVGRVLHPAVFLVLVEIGLPKRGTTPAEALLGRTRGIGLDS